MVLTKVNKVQESQYKNGSYLVFFDFNEREVYSVVTGRVLKYLKVENVNKGDTVEVIKSFNGQGKPIYLIKSVEVRV